MYMKMLQIDSYFILSQNIVYCILTNLQQTKSRETKGIYKLNKIFAVLYSLFVHKYANKQSLIELQSLRHQVNVKPHYKVIWLRNTTIFFRFAKIITVQNFRIFRSFFKFKVHYLQQNKNQCFFLSKTTKIFRLRNPWSKVSFLY